MSELNRQQGRTALLDKSSNGTFINKVRVGKEKSSRLAHEIGVLECDFALLRSRYDVYNSYEVA